MTKKLIKFNLIVLIIFVFLVGNVLATEPAEEIVEEVSNTSASDTTNSNENKLDNLKNEKNELEENLNLVNSEIELIESQMSKELYELEELNNTILRNEQQIAIMKVEEEKLVSFINATTEEYKKITKKYEEQKELLEERLVAMYEIRNTSYLDVLLNSRSISEFISNYYFIKQIAESDRNLVNSTEKIKDNVEAIKKDLEIKNKELEDNREQSEKINISLENMVAIKNSKVLQLSEEEVLLHQTISEYQEQLLNVEKEIKILSILSVNSEYVGGIMAWPVPGYTRITSPFGMRTHPITGVYKLHTGVDIGAPIGSIFIAANDGIVVKAEYNVAYGNMVVIDHGGGITTLYAHGNSILVEVGQTVSTGTPVLEVGTTGYSTGPHAHFEVRINGEYQNPLEYITDFDRVNDTTAEKQVVELTN